MSVFTNFTLSVEKGLCGNIGKLSFKQRDTGQPPATEIMLFLSPNSQETISAENKALATQIINVHFPEAMYETLKQYGIGDLIRIHFERIDLSKGISNQSGKEVLSIRVRAKNIELLRKAQKKKDDNFYDDSCYLENETLPGSILSGTAESRNF